MASCGVKCDGSGEDRAECGGQPGLKAAARKCVCESGR